MARAKTSANATPRKKQAATMPAVNSFESRKDFAPSDLELEIRRRAYELYERRGYTPGRENEDWLVAEQEVLARYNQLQTA